MPLITSTATSSLIVSISSTDSDVDLYCTRVSLALLDKEHVHADGSLGTLKPNGSVPFSILFDCEGCASKTAVGNTAPTAVC